MFLDILIHRGPVKVFIYYVQHLQVILFIELMSFEILSMSFFFFE